MKNLCTTFHSCLWPHATFHANFGFGACCGMHASVCILLHRRQGLPNCLQPLEWLLLWQLKSADLSDTLIRCKIADLANTLTMHKHD